MGILRKYSKNIVSVIVLVGLTIMWANGIDYRLSDGCDILSRVLYPFCHVNFWHMTANWYCLYTIMKSPFRDTWLMWLLSYLVAVSAPSVGLSTMGLSGVLYAVLAMLSFQSVDKAKYHAWIVIFLILMMMFPNVNSFIHFYCYACGIVIGWLIHGDR